MSQRPNPTIIGAFVLGAMALIVVAMFLLVGGSLFERKQSYVMYFEGSVFGLQVGSPVVFRGVQIGSVKRIDLRYDADKKRLIIPIIVESTQTAVPDANGDGKMGTAPDITSLVNQGLRARLATQSFLTGQLYVELDFFPEKPAVFRSPSQSSREIPTIPSPVQEIAQKLQNIDLEDLIHDVSAIAEATRQFVTGPELSRAMKNLDGALTALKSASERIDKRIDPLAKALGDTTKATASTLVSAQKAMERVGSAADRLGAIATDTQAPLEEVRAAAAELREAASTLNQVAGEGLPAVVQTSRTMKDLAQAARALQDLAESLEQQPSALLFGKQKPRE